MGEPLEARGGALSRGRRGRAGQRDGTERVGRGHELAQAGAGGVAQVSVRNAAHSQGADVGTTQW